MELSATMIIPTILVILAAALYWLLTKNFNYWEKHGIPSVPAKPFVGSLEFSKVAHLSELERYKKYGRLYGFYEAERPVLSVSEPDLLKNIMVKDFQMFPNRRSFPVGNPLIDNMVSVMAGENWKRVRTIITPAFSTGKIRKMTDIILDSAKSFSQQISEDEKAKIPFDAKRAFGCFTMDVIASSAFGTKIDSHQNPDNEFVQTARNLFNRAGIPWRFIFFFLFPKLMQFFRIPVIAQESLDFFKDATLQIINKRRECGKVYNDFMQLLMNAADETEKANADHGPITTTETTDDSEKSMINDMGHEAGNEQIFKQTRQYESLNYDELVAQCVMFFLAGYDTTASTLSFSSYCLALNTDVQEKVIQEVDKVLEENEGKLTYDGVQSMKYLDKVISETLRIYPPAFRLERAAVEDYDLGAYNFTIPKGMLVAISVYGLHHDPDNYPEPDKFDPERFSPEEKERRHPYAYLPFGAGPRNCLGMRFALMEIKFCLAYLLSQYRLKRVKETTVPLEWVYGAGALQSKPILLGVESRKDRVIVTT